MKTMADLIEDVERLGGYGTQAQEALERALRFTGPVSSRGSVWLSENGQLYRQWQSSPATRHLTIRPADQVPISAADPEPPTQSWRDRPPLL